MIPFDAAHKAVHYPADRRFRFWIRPSFVAGAVALILVPPWLAWGQAAILGLPFEDLHLPLNGLIEQE